MTAYLLVLLLFCFYIVTEQYFITVQIDDVTADYNHTDARISFLRMTYPSSSNVSTKHKPFWSLVDSNNRSAYM